MLYQYTLFDPKTGMQFNGALMTHMSAENQNEELRRSGRAQRWIMQDDVPAGAAGLDF